MTTHYVLAPRKASHLGSTVISGFHVGDVPGVLWSSSESDSTNAPLALGLSRCWPPTRPTRRPAPTGETRRQDLVDDGNHCHEDGRVRAALPTEPYAAVSEFVEIALAPAWTELDTQLTDALRSAPAAPDAAVVDIGAGGGRGVLAAARALPSGSIVAVEPSAPLRAVLLSRLALDPALRERTTVLATDLAGAELPARWSAALVLNMAGHLDPPERRGLWRTAAERLLPGAPLLVTVQPPFAVTTVPEMDWGRVRVGAHTCDLGQRRTRRPGLGPLDHHLPRARRRAAAARGTAGAPLVRAGPGGPDRRAGRRRSAGRGHRGAPGPRRAAGRAAMSDVDSADRDSADRYDVVVVGGGPAGLNAALVLGRQRRRVLLLDSGEYRNESAGEMHMFLSRDGADPAELRATGRAELERHPTVRVERGPGACAVAAEAVEQGFRVRTADGHQPVADALVLATGQADRLPPTVAGLADRWGESVFHCPFCHGWEARDKPLAVLGGTPEQAGMALYLRSRISDDVVLCTDGPPQLPAGMADLLAARGIALRTQPVVRLDGELDALTLVFDGGEPLARGALFHRTATAQRSPLAEQLGCEILPDGCVRVDEGQRTTVAGVYAAGDTARLPTVPVPLTFALLAAADGLRAAVTLEGDRFTASLSPR
jgi:thioredoxin reductase